MRTACEKQKGSDLSDQTQKQNKTNKKRSRHSFNYLSPHTDT